MCQDNGDDSAFLVASHNANHGGSIAGRVKFREKQKKEGGCVKLYLVEMKRYGTFYVVATNPTKAEEKIIAHLQDNGIGFETYRHAVKIEFLGEETPLGMFKKEGA